MKPFFICVTIILIVTVILLFNSEFCHKNPKPSPNYTWTPCIDACSNAQEQCMQGCSNTGGDSYCNLTCVIDGSLCADSCPGVPSIRNGCVFGVNIFRESDSVLIGEVGGWSPHAFELLPSDFPVVVTTQTSLVQGWNPNDDENYLVISTPGCFVVWFWGGYYTTNIECTENSELLSANFYKNMPPRS